jgi:hypothetical protein
MADTTDNEERLLSNGVHDMSLPPSAERIKVQNNRKIAIVGWGSFVVAFTFTDVRSIAMCETGT